MRRGSYGPLGTWVSKCTGYMAREQGFLLEIDITGKGGIRGTLCQGVLVLIKTRRLEMEGRNVRASPGAHRTLYLFSLMPLISVGRAREPRVS